MTQPSNPYRPPAAPVTSRDVDELRPRSRGLKYLAIALAAISLLTAGLAPAALNSFRQIFEGFGAELPLLSRIAVGGLWIWTALAAVAIGIAFWIGRTERASGATLMRMRIALGLLIVAVIAFFTVSVIALYLPIFRLGEVV